MSHLRDGFIVARVGHSRKVRTAFSLRREISEGSLVATTYTLWIPAPASVCNVNTQRAKRHERKISVEDIGRHHMLGFSSHRASVRAKQHRCDRDEERRPSHRRDQGP